MTTTPECAGVGPDASQPTGEQRGGCEGCNGCYVDAGDGQPPITWLYRAVVRDLIDPETAAPVTETVRYCDECAQFVRAGTHERYAAGLLIASDLVGRTINYVRPLTGLHETGRVVRDIPEHNAVAIAAPAVGRFRALERVIHRANITIVLPESAPEPPKPRRVHRFFTPGTMSGAQSAALIGAYAMLAYAAVYEATRGATLAARLHAEKCRDLITAFGEAGEPYDSYSGKPERRAVREATHAA